MDEKRERSTQKVGVVPESRTIVLKAVNMSFADLIKKVKNKVNKEEVADIDTIRRVLEVNLLYGSRGMTVRRLHLRVLS